jgi:hypothetical protein
VKRFHWSKLSNHTWHNWRALMSKSRSFFAPKSYQSTRRNHVSIGTNIELKRSKDTRRCDFDAIKIIIFSLAHLFNFYSFVLLCDPRRLIVVLPVDASARVISREVVVIPRSHYREVEGPLEHPNSLLDQGW